MCVLIEVYISGRPWPTEINNSGDILDKLKARDFNATSLSTYNFQLFTLLYLIIWLKINLLILLKEPSIEKALLTLHVLTEMHSLLRKTIKISCMVLSKCMWCAELFVGQHCYLIWHQVILTSSWDSYGHWLCFPGCQLIPVLLTCPSSDGP